ncbi:uncharacterized protein LOC141914569 isoform X2 [Tubulanus polymorphus]
MKSIIALLFVAVVGVAFARYTVEQYQTMCSQHCDRESGRVTDLTERAKLLQTCKSHCQKTAMCIRSKCGGSIQSAEDVCFVNCQRAAAQACMTS